MAAAGEIPEFVDEYRIEQHMLGAGSNGCVRLGVHLHSQDRVAVKIFDAQCQPQIRERAIQEAEVLSKLRHENIITLHGIYEEDAYIFMIMELAERGDLSALLERHGRLEEYTAREYFKQVVVAVLHCHQLGIAHHDLKLENMLLTADNTIRLTDFGLSVRLDSEGLIHDHYAGSPLYMSPEIFSLQPHTEACDVWSLGVCLYYMVTDIFPFFAETYNELEERVLFDQVVFPANMGLSDNLRDLICRMLTKDPKQRITLAEVMQHSWWFESRRHPLAATDH